MNLRPCRKVVTFWNGLVFLFAAIFAMLAAPLAHEGEFDAIAIPVLIVSSFFLVRAAYGLWKDLRSLNRLTYSIDESGLSVVNDLTGEREVYRSSEVAEVEVFKVPLGYKVKIYRNGDPKGPWKRVLGVRIYLDSNVYANDVDRGVIQLCSQDEVERIRSLLMRS